MAAPKGNQYAKGNPNSGRPITPLDYEGLAKDLIEFALQEDTLILRKWAIKHNITQDTMIDYTQRADVFKQAYEQARNIIGARREGLALQGIINQKVYDRYAALHDKALARHEKEIRQETAEQSAQIINVLTRGSKADSKEK